MPALPASIRLLEVGPRDGLQNEARLVPTEQKVEFVEALVRAGITRIEVTSFVHPRAVPQLADAAEVMRALPRAPGVTYSALVPNRRGLERAMACGVDRIAVFTAASDTFARRNINMTVDESLSEFAPVVRDAVGAGISVRGYVSTCFVCPYEGSIAPARVRDVVARLVGLGVDEVAVSDTIGAAVPGDISATVGPLVDLVPIDRIALHLHDTYGTALVNVYAAMEMGITAFDASAGGLGGCPYAPGAAGNLATEDLVYMLGRMGIETGVDLDRLFAASRLIADALGRDLPGKQYQRMKAACRGTA